MDGVPGKISVLLHSVGTQQTSAILDEYGTRTGKLSMYSVRVRRVVVTMGHTAYHRICGVPKVLSEEGMSLSDHIR
jgi:hypothetical protein